MGLVDREELQGRAAQVEVVQAARALQLGRRGLQRGPGGLGGARPGGFGGARPGGFHSGARGGLGGPLPASKDVKRRPLSS